MYEVGAPDGREAAPQQSHVLSSLRLDEEEANSNKPPPSPRVSMRGINCSFKESTLHSEGRTLHWEEFGAWANA